MPTCTLRIQVINLPKRSKLDFVETPIFLGDYLSSLLLPYFIMYHFETKYFVLLLYIIL